MRNQNCIVIISQAGNGQLESAKWLVSKGASVSHADDQGFTPLLAAALEVFLHGDATRARSKLTVPVRVS
jgi:hypothetical protein